MRGASALQEMLDDEARAPVRVLVVWMPVLVTDVAPPTAGVLEKASDGRVMQHWDAKRGLSARLLAASRAGSLPIPDTFGQSVVWDYALVYPPGVTWGDSLPPRPEYAGGPVVSVRPQLRSRMLRPGRS